MPATARPSAAKEASNRMGQPAAGLPFPTTLTLIGPATFGAATRVSTSLLMISALWQGDRLMQSLLRVLCKICGICKGTQPLVRFPLSRSAYDHFPANCLSDRFPGFAATAMTRPAERAPPVVGANGALLRRARIFASLGLLLLNCRSPSIGSPPVVKV